MQKCKKENVRKAPYPLTFWTDLAVSSVQLMQQTVKEKL